MAPQRLQEKARSYHQALVAEFGPEALAAGGNLFLGWRYAQTDRIYLGLNPGTADVGDDLPFETDLGAREETPLYEESRLPYWRNFRRFFDAPRLREWMDDTTHAFLIPWRAYSTTALRNTPWYEKALEYSGDLVRTMIHDHHARIVVVAGKHCLALLASKWFLDFDWQASSVYSHGSGTYQWRKVLHGDMAIYQLPHFSRANSEGRLDLCRAWFVNEVLGSDITDAVE
ncbi:hypothetical protein U7230_07665 [Carboxydochorda subterranea]|uniref:Uncharacterized protein n=1 Tax=Carboxydichorda subterranea TaxID=3109565 RepID=A0ABZ1C1V3_9FIRM|nr:hypothetical protein [Limnochorda sp. L945t]WRP18858.1 hypothetical protein U7230_07665 [Limnochorda sp. L945t]